MSCRPSTPISIAAAVLIALAGCGGGPDVQDVVDAVLDVPAADAAGDVAASDSTTDSVIDAIVADTASDATDDATADGLADASPDQSPAVTVLDLSEVGDIHDMWGSPDTSIWAVGSGGLVLVLRDGQFVPGPIPPTRADLYGVDGAGGTVYAVGAGGVAVRWRDGAWQDLDCPARKDLMSISCPSADECYAVGLGGTMVHYLDGQWDVQDAGVTWDLYGVLSEAGGGTLATGAFGSLFELDGTDWISSQIAGSVARMRDIYRAPDGTVVVVGSLGTIVMRRPGSTRWEQQLTNDPREPARDLYAVTGTSASDIWAAGDSGVLIHYDGTHWELATVAGPAGVYADLRGAVAAPWLPGAGVGESGLMLAGGMLSSLLTYDAEDAVWHDLPPGPAVDLNSVWAVDGDPEGDERAIFVGDDGLALEYSGGRFGLLETGIFSALNSVSGGIAVGDSGTMAAFAPGPAGMTVQSILSSTVEDLVDVHHDGDGWLIAGAEGSVFTMDEAFAPTFLSQVSGMLTSVCRTSAGVFVGGEGGLLASLPAGDGDGVFGDVVTFTQSAIRDLAPLPDGRVLAVGDNGIVLACGLSACDRLYSEPASFLYGAGGSSGLPLFAVGWAGSVLRYDGHETVRIESGTHRVFYGLDAASDGGTVFIAAQGGFAALLEPSAVVVAQ